jgi:hypothetical protein
MPDETKPSSVRFHYVKSNYFRVIHADGAYGGLTPYGGIFLSLYNDRKAIPDETVQSVGENGLLGPEISERTKTKDGIEREVETCIIMTLNTAKAIQQWLEERIKILEKLQEERQPQESEVKL